MKPLVSLACLIVLLAAHLHLSEAHDTPDRWVELHNAVRAKVGVSPIKWNTTLENYAQKYSEERSGDCDIIHSKGPYGENIYWGQGDGLVDAAAAMKAWADDEIPYYDYNAMSCLGGQQCLHYTQIVWNNTNQVGCGIANCTGVENKVFMTCSYYPPGNYIGQRPY